MILLKPVCRGKANTAITVSIPVNPTKRSASAKLIASKNVRFSFLRWIQKTNVANMLAIRMTTGRTMRIHKNIMSVVSNSTESNEWLEMNVRLDSLLSGWETVRFGLYFISDGANSWEEKKNVDLNLGRVFQKKSLIFNRVVQWFFLISAVLLSIYLKTNIPINRIQKYLN